MPEVYEVTKAGDQFVVTPKRTVQQNRLPYIIGGTLAILLGLRRAGVVCNALIFGGACAAYYGLTGRGPVDQFLKQRKSPAAGQVPDDVVDEASMDSFPASDAPGYMGQAV